MLVRQSHREDSNSLVCLIEKKKICRWKKIQKLLIPFICSCLGVEDLDIRAFQCTSVSVLSRISAAGAIRGNVIWHLASIWRHMGCVNMPDKCVLDFSSALPPEVACDSSLMMWTNQETLIFCLWLFDSKQVWMKGVYIFSQEWKTSLCPRWKKGNQVNQKGQMKFLRALNSSSVTQVLSCIGW